MKWPRVTLFCFFAIFFFTEAISDKGSDDNFLELLRRYREKTQTAQHLPPKRDIARTAHVPPKRDTGVRGEMLANQQFLPKQSDVRAEILQNAVRILENNMRLKNMHQSDSLQKALKRDYDFGDIDAGARATNSTSTKLPTTTPVTTTTTTAPLPPANTLPPYLADLDLPKYIIDWLRSNGMI